MLELNQKQSKSITTTELLRVYNFLVEQNCNVILYHNHITYSFSLFVQADSYKTAKKFFPKWFKDKTAEYGKTIEVRYK